MGRKGYALRHVSLGVAPGPPPAACQRLKKISALADTFLPPVIIESQKGGLRVGVTLILRCRTRRTDALSQSTLPALGFVELSATEETSHGNGS